MTTSPIAASAGNARQQLASSLASLQQDPNLPSSILDVLSGLARAMGPLFQVERGTGNPALLYIARAALQETLGRQVAEALVTHLGARAAGVRLDAAHGCLSTCGERQGGARVVTHGYAGAWRDDEAARREFWSALPAGGGER